MAGGGGGWREFKTQLLKIVPLGEEGEGWRAAILLVSNQLQ